MKQNNHGFTLVEMVVVLVLISIISATVLARSISTNQIDFVGQVDKIRTHIRYAQSMAMKRLDVISDDRWGIRCSGTQYWLFNYTGFGTENTSVRLPGEQPGKITLSDLGVTNATTFTLYFNGLGAPFINSPTAPVGSPFNIIITAGSLTRNLRIIPETGLIIIQ
jgi:prepilin-type N-terminal cleavage/methylation domain-containing protein